MVASGICHTDISLYDGWGSTDTPVVLGHEGSGVVEQVGTRVKGAKPGDHVVLSYQSCGRCQSCRIGHPTDCEHFYELNFGFERLDGSNALHRSGVRGHFFGQSSFATHALATERNLVKVPSDLPLEVLAPLGCGLQTGAGTVMNSLGVAKGQSIAVFGTGSVGLAAVMAAHIVEADPIVGVDILPRRLEIAEELGASHVIDSANDDLISRIKAITGAGVDYVVETSGDWKMHRIAIEVLNPHGTVALLAGGGGAEDLGEGRRALGIIQGDAIPQQFIPQMIDQFREGRFPFDRLITFYDFHDINRAIADSKRGTTIKPVLRISEAW
jgi:aryl-alcohol dehydrogenase